MTTLNVTNYHRKILSLLVETKEFLEKYQELNVYNQNMKKKKLLSFITEIEQVDLNPDETFENEMRIADNDEDFVKLDFDKHIIQHDAAIIKYWKRVYKIASTEELIKKWQDMRVKYDFERFEGKHPLKEEKVKK